ncbi:DUF6477 family protein [Tropicimonas sp.]|uniref:DUF6477 family protein n=1 Tax=Tropicimonas sp. TaxID=2067044 RepID=UPI003A85CF49
MNEFTKTLRALRRPSLLISAARAGARSYNRARDLKRIAHCEELPAPERAVRRLMSLEADLDRARRDRDTTYSVTRHVDILIALIAEARLMLRVATAA